MLLHHIKKDKQSKLDPLLLKLLKKSKKDKQSKIGLHYSLKASKRFQWHASKKISTYLVIYTHYACIHQAIGLLYFRSLPNNQYKSIRIGN